eukprot:15437305-Alexandrium_andersonii.AAC.1
MKCARTSESLQQTAHSPMRSRQPIHEFQLRSRSTDHSHPPPSQLATPARKRHTRATVQHRTEKGRIARSPMDHHPFSTQSTVRNLPDASQSRLDDRHARVQLRPQHLDADLQLTMYTPPARTPDTTQTCTTCLRASTPKPPALHANAGHANTWIPIA